MSLRFFRSIDEKIFQRVVAVSCGERLLTYFVMRQGKLGTALY